jgi:hypothetical protein
MTETVCVWNQNTTGNASTGAWTGRTPIAGDDVRLNGTGIGNMTWDIAISVQSFIVNGEYSGTMTIAATTTIVGQFLIAGNVIYSSGTITGTVTFGGTITLTLSASWTLTNVVVIGSVTTAGTQNLIVTADCNISGTFSVSASTYLECISPCTLEVTGTVTGASAVSMMNYSGTTNWLLLGTITVLSFQIQNTGGSNITCTLGNGIQIGCPLYPVATGAGYMTLNTGNWPLACTTLTIGAKALLVANASAIAVTSITTTNAISVDWGTSQVLWKASGTFTCTDTTNQLYDLVILPGITCTLASDLVVTHDYSNNGGTLTVGSYTATYPLIRGFTASDNCFLGGVSLGHITQLQVREYCQLQTTPMPMVDSSNTIVLDITGTERDIQIQGERVTDGKMGNAAFCNWLVSLLAGQQNIVGPFSFNVFPPSVDLYPEVSILAFVDEFDYTVQAGQMNEITYTLKLVRGASA